MSVMYRGAGAHARIALGDEWQVRPTRELLQRLGKLVGGDNVRLVFGPRHAA